MQLTFGCVKECVWQPFPICSPVWMGKVKQTLSYLQLTTHVGFHSGMYTHSMLASIQMYNLQNTNIHFLQYQAALAKYWKVDSANTNWMWQLINGRLAIVWLVPIINLCDRRKRYIRLYLPTQNRLVRPYLSSTVVHWKYTPGHWAATYSMANVSYDYWEIKLFRKTHRNWLKLYHWETRCV